MKYHLAALFFIIHLSVISQDAIVTDRPTQSAASTVVPVGSVLIEYGFVYEGASSDVTNITWGNFLARVGIANGFELRLTQNILQSDISASTGDETVSGT